MKGQQKLYLAIEANEKFAGNFCNPQKRSKTALGVGLNWHPLLCDRNHSFAGMVDVSEFC